MKSELVTPAHLARRAVVYIRQSTPAQVVSNQESLRLQYALTGRARDLGWHAADIDVIDADLGQSGASLIGRDGFKDLAARVGLGEIGIVLSIDVTRLARNCSDWYPLLDVCALRGCLIADRDGVYDPGSANGRLLLGLKGSISELELHTIRSRLTAGLLAKAQRGDLALTLPTGLMRMPGDVVVLDPDLEVQSRLSMVFSSFARLRSAAAVMRDLAARGLDLPRRDRHGDLRWTRPTVSAVTGILKNPAYAGAFVYGRKRMKTRDELACLGGKPQKTPRTMEDWRIIVKDRYPAYMPVAGPIRRTRISSPTTGRSTWPGRAEARRARESCCCRASPTARAAGTRCSSATRAAASTSAIICAPSRVCRNARPYVPPPSMPLSGGLFWRPSHRLKSMSCRALTSCART